MKEVEDLLQEFACLESGNTPSSVVPQNYNTSRDRSSKLLQASCPLPASLSAGCPVHRTAAPQPGQVPAARHPEPRSLPFSKPHDDVELLLLELDVGISSKASIPSQQPPAASTAHHSNSNTAPLSTSSLHKALAAAPRATTSKARCSTTYVCGPDAAAAAPGEELPGQAACCSSMRCTKCDFQVVRFDGFRWVPHTEYLLLRNAYPSEARLAGALVRDASCSALCCQCSWLSVVERQRVGLGGSGPGAACRWVCAGHWMAAGEGGRA